MTIEWKLRVDVDDADEFQLRLLDVKIQSAAMKAITFGRLSKAFRHMGIERRVTDDEVVTKASKLRL
jgi:hypothetical protein